MLNANYVRAALKGAYNLPYETDSLHEVVFDDKLQKDAGVTTMDVAKRLIDHGFHPPTVYFPLVVHGALMIEPTETESKETLDEFVAAMQAIAEEAKARSRGAQGRAPEARPGPARRDPRRPQAGPALDPGDEGRVARTSPSTGSPGTPLINGGFFLLFSRGAWTARFFVAGCRGHGGTGPAPTGGDAT